MAAPSSEAPNPAFRLFVGNLPVGLSQATLRLAMSKAGRVTSLFHIDEDPSMAGRCGWALVLYSDAQSAKTALKSMNGILELPGSTSPVEVRWAQRRLAEAALAREEAAAVARQELCRPVSFWKEYTSPEGYPYYFNEVSGKTQWVRPKEMDAAAKETLAEAEAVAQRTTPSVPEPSPAQSDASGPPGCNLFVFHIPSDWNDMDVVQHFQHFGKIKSARIQRDPTGRSRGFGFVSFDNYVSAVGAVKLMNGFNVGGKLLKVQMKKGEEQYLPSSAQHHVAQLTKLLQQAKMY